MKQNLNLICEAKVSLKKEADQANPSGKIKARVTTWGAREGEDGRRFNYQPEGFADWAKEFASSGKPMPMFLNHNDMGMPVGEWSEFTFDADGMSAEGKLFMNTVGGSDLYNILKESPQLFGGVSVGAYADEAKMVDKDGNDADDDDDEAYFQITKGGLREVSVVMHPNNPMAEVHKLEFFRPDGSADLKVLESALREAGLSKKDAVTAASMFKAVIAERDAKQEVESETPERSDSDAEVTEAEILAALEERELLEILNAKLKG